MSHDQATDRAERIANRVDDLLRRCYSLKAQKGDSDCKYWLHPENFDIEEAYTYNMNPADKRAIRQIIFEHFDYIIAEYDKFHKGELR